VLTLHVAAEAHLDIVDVTGSGSFSLNTTHSEHLGVARDSFTLSLDGDVEVLKILRFHAGFTVRVGVGTFTVPVPAHGLTPAHTVAITLGQGEWGFQVNASIDFFGIITVSGNGFIDSRGDFSMHWTASSR